MEQDNNEFYSKVIEAKVTESMVEKYNMPEFLPEFSKDFCAYNDPAPELQSQKYDAKTGNFIFEDEVPQDLPEAWLKKLTEDDLETVLGKPRNKKEFIALKQAITQVENKMSEPGMLYEHPVFPTYSKDMTIKWKELCELEEKKLREKQCEQIWHDMWQMYPETMRDSIPDYIPQEEELKGLVVVYVNVGQLPEKQAEVYIDKIKKGSTKLRNIPLDYGIIWLPVRSPEQNRVELIKF